jgi:Parkin co-regulated protein
MQSNKFSIYCFRFDVFEEHNVNSSLFRTLLLRGDIPCQRSYCREDQNKGGTYLMWKISPQDLDYCHYLPIFFDGYAVQTKKFSHSNKFQFLFIRLCEPKFPYNVIACYAIHDMLNAGGDKVLPVIPQLIIPIKNALNTRNRAVIASTLRIIQHLCMCGKY